MLKVLKYNIHCYVCIIHVTDGWLKPCDSIWEGGGNFHFEDLFYFIHLFCEHLKALDNIITKKLPPKNYAENPASYFFYRKTIELCVFPWCLYKGSKQTSKQFSEFLLEDIYLQPLNFFCLINFFSICHTSVMPAPKIQLCVFNWSMTHCPKNKFRTTTAIISEQIYIFLFVLFSVVVVCFFGGWVGEGNT